MRQGRPDGFAASLIAVGKSPEEASAIAWRFGFDALRKAVNRGENFAFETTLGGKSIVAELQRALDLEREVHIFCVGLASPDLHVERVRARVARGGHSI